eukprot:1638827-Lingulodinium_polyedra.AAC.1
MAARGNAALALAAACAQEDSLALLKRDMLAHSSRGPANAMLQRWRLFHQAWFGKASSPFPLTIHSVRA